MPARVPGVSVGSVAGQVAVGIVTERRSVERRHLVVGVEGVAADRAWQLDAGEAARLLHDPPVGVPSATLRTGSGVFEVSHRVPVQGPCHLGNSRNLFLSPRSVH